MVAPPPLLTLTRLMLRDFRSYPALTLGLDCRVAVLAGENGTGKTNLLEAVSLLGPGRGLRGARLAELARITPEGDRLPWAAAGRFRGPWGEFDIGTGTPEGGPVERRSFRLDGQPVRGSADLADRVAAVWLTPQMDRLFQDGAGERRRFLDRLVWALEPGHARQVAAYDRAMSQRNRLLAGGGVSRVDPDWLSALEDAMARHGVALAAARRTLAARLNAALAEGVTGAFPVALLELVCPVAAALDEAPALAVEDRLRAEWEETRHRDAAAGVTLAGPHRADLGATHASKGVPAALCSTGEQKALLVSTILAHAALIAAARGFGPLLLLDEVAAHLDAPRRAALFAALADLPAQVFLTGTDPEVFAPLRGVAAGFRTAPGSIVPLGDFPVPGAS
jgi:DNA replication and repair protein RecF